ncbi:MAG TPA: hypothetical protein VFS43_03870 [Polyangiaceae bacterium]|nr:hypothetical protein [Polyangiaceae bacterium]
MRVEVIAKTLRFPEKCPCCGGRADIEHPFFATRVTGGRLRTKSWPFPYCSACTEHARLWPQPLGSGGRLAVVLTLGLWWLVTYLLRESAKKAARARCTESCACGAFAVRFKGWKGARQIFDITSEAYAVAFALANIRGLTNISPELRAALSREKKERERAFAAQQEEKERHALQSGRERIRRESDERNAVTERRIRAGARLRKMG